MSGIPREEYGSLFGLRDRLDPEYPGHHADRLAWLAARDRLVLANRGLAARLAKKYLGRCGNRLDFEDMMQAGIAGLIAAAEGFDPARGVLFSSYASWAILGEIQGEVADRGGTLIRVPRNSHPLYRSQAEKLGRETSDRSRAALAIAVGPGRAGLPRWGDHIADRPATPGGEGGPSAEQKEAAEACRALLGRLAGRERRVLVLVFGLDGDPPRTLEEAGGELGVSRERVRQIKDAALRRLRLAPVPRFEFAS